MRLTNMLPLLFIAGISAPDAGYAAMPTPQLVASPQTGALAAQGGHFQNATNPSTTAEQAGGVLSQTTVDQKIADDKQEIRAGLAPPDIIKYDLEIAKMMLESKAILATHDRARARIWEAKYRSIVEARNKSVQDFLAPSTAMNNAIANVLESSRISRGSAPNGARGGGGGVHPCPQGPGPGEVQVGTETEHGGEPLCQ